ncbi:hypothetical protein GCM10010970_22690 [Silvimonas iriomotensis]|uniref:Uncharacterized protein n=1 Tax=Silvimonas iriomotensis TaxID=449662 RepID=A0ABQ2PAF4_9NEIS|nr:hypothetical protein GCM10010970_22690 [Silvimonas iriomotensis]
MMQPFGSVGPGLLIDAGNEAEGAIIEYLRTVARKAPPPFRAYHAIVVPANQHRELYVVSVTTPSPTYGSHHSHQQSDGPPAAPGLDS